MGTELFNGSIRTKVPRAIKTALAIIAETRHVKPSVVQREALREYIKRHRRLLPRKLACRLVL